MINASEIYGDKQLPLPWMCLFVVSRRPLRWRTIESSACSRGGLARSRNDGGGDRDSL
jgi:hypothetical protein